MALFMAVHIAFRICWQVHLPGSWHAWHASAVWYRQWRTLCADWSFSVLNALPHGQWTRYPPGVVAVHALRWSTKRPGITASSHAVHFPDQRYGSIGRVLSLILCANVVADVVSIFFL